MSELTRRETIAGGAVALTSPSKSGRMPVAFVPHGGGPWPFMDNDFGDPEGVAGLRRYLESLQSLPRTPPRALLVVSAHWEASVPTVMTHARPPMLFDYYGFPPSTYRLSWPAAGDAKLAGRVRGLLEGAGFKTGEDAERGFDHGTFVPMMLTYPRADLPVVQLSLEKGLDPARHLAMGRALAPLRDEGVFIIGSGMTFHNLRIFFDGRGVPVAEAFDAWLKEACLAPAPVRNESLARWEQAPGARAAHPREEHLLPLMVVAGAAGDDRATVAWNGTFGGLRLSAYHFA